MKANELSVSDWVCVAMHSVNGKERLTPPMRVIAIGEAWVQVLVDPKSGYPDKYVIENIRPVPLDFDILRKSGFEDGAPGAMRLWIRDKYKFATKGVRAELDEHTNKIIITIQAERGFYYKQETQYLHTLQHAMRLAGIEKEITL